MKTKERTVGYCALLKTRLKDLGLRTKEIRTMLDVLGPSRSGVVIDWLESEIRYHKETLVYEEFYDELIVFCRSHFGGVYETRDLKYRFQEIPKIKNKDKQKAYQELENLLLSSDKFLLKIIESV